jgi:hypothetical protein
MRSTPAGVSVPARKEHSYGVQPMDDVRFVIDEALPNGHRIRVQTLEDGLLRSQPKLIDVRVGSVGQVGALVVIDDIDQPPATSHKRVEHCHTCCLAGSLIDGSLTGRVVSRKKRSGDSFPVG